jgi:hypothetical protein
MPRFAMRRGSYEEDGYQQPEIQTGVLKDETLMDTTYDAVKDEWEIFTGRDFASYVCLILMGVCIVAWQWNRFKAKRKAEQPARVKKPDHVTNKPKWEKR